MNCSRVALWLCALALIAVFVALGGPGCGVTPTGPTPTPAQTPTLATGTVRGMVTNEDGTQPAAGAEVALESNPAVQTTAGQDGRFVLSGVPLGVPQRIVAYRLGFGSGTSEQFTLTEQNPELTLEEPIRLSTSSPPPPPPALMTPIPTPTPRPTG